jgi:hypothetical protein
MTTTPTQDARIRELMLVNLFAVFSERDPELRMKAIAANYTDELYTLLNGFTDRE